MDFPTQRHYLKQLAMPSIEAHGLLRSINKGKLERKMAPYGASKEEMLYIAHSPYIHAFILHSFLSPSVLSSLPFFILPFHFSVDLEE